MASRLLFTMFRLQLDEKKQIEMELKPHYSRTAALKDVLYEAPFGEGRWGKWTIGNVQQIDEVGYYFRLGKIRKERTQAFQDGRFIDVAFDRAPYTHVFLDIHRQVLAVARNREISSSSEGLADSFCGIATYSKTFREAGYECKAFPIPDPEGILEWIREADKIKSLWITFRQPNAFDEEKDFRGPMKRTLKALRASSGSTQFHGADIDKEKAVDITRATAAGGNKVTVKLKAPGERATIVRSTDESPLRLAADSVDGEDARAAFLERLRQKYKDTRGPDRGGGE